jgi:hypothetical protein
VYPRVEIAGKVTQAPEISLAASPESRFAVRCPSSSFPSFASQDSFAIMTSSSKPLGVMPAPLGVEPDFSGNRTDLQSRIVIVYVIMTVLSAFVLGLRLYTRIFIRHMTGLDDALVVLSWLGCVAWLVICFEGKVSCAPSMFASD